MDIRDEIKRGLAGSIDAVLFQHKQEFGIHIHIYVDGSKQMARYTRAREKITVKFDPPVTTKEKTIKMTDFDEVTFVQFMEWLELLIKKYPITGEDKSD